MTTNDKEIAAHIRSLCFSGDIERDHGKADNVLMDLLLELGYTETLKAYNEVDKWYA